MNVLVDTNVLVSAVIRDRLPQRIIDEIVFRDDWFWIVTAEIESEYRHVLAGPKFKIPDAIQQRWTAFLEEVTFASSHRLVLLFLAILKTSVSLPRLLPATRII